MTVYNSIETNKWKTFFIMAIFVMFFATVSYVLARGLGFGLGFVGVMLIISGLTTFFSYYYSDKMVLSLGGAQPVTKSQLPEIYRIVENLTIASGMPMPKIYVSNESAPNAFATGRDPQHAAVCVTKGLLEKLKKTELEGVLAHELSHIKNFDTRLMGVVSVLVGSLAILSDFFMRNLLWGNMGGDNDNRGSNSNGVFILLGIALAILAPIAATLIQFAVSRKREYLADATGVLLTRYPEGLAQALEKIAADKTVMRQTSVATAHFYFENPFDDQKVKSWFHNLFSTHPPVQERIKILRSM